MKLKRYKISININYLLGLVCLLPVILIFGAFISSPASDFDLAKQEILLRNIGHEVLLQAGDSTSRVLPVKKIAEHEYQIKFENEFTFQSDSLVSIISRSIKKNEFGSNYVVSVLSCANKDVVFGYAIAGNIKDNVVPCSGRKQPKNCYLIDLKFQNTDINGIQKGLLMSGLPLLAFVGFMIGRTGKTRKTNVEPDSGTFKIGDTIYDPVKRQITYGLVTTDLTSKENNLLHIFASSPNIMIERAKLQKEIWEDEGVIVGRSLDMFISKLRKKLESDASVKLSNIHGKGYKLEC